MYPSSPTFRRAAELYEAISSSQHVVNDILGRAEMHRVLIYNDHNLTADSVKDNHFIYKTVQRKTRSYSINCLDTATMIAFDHPILRIFNNLKHILLYIHNP